MKAIYQANIVMQSYHHFTTLESYFQKSIGVPVTVEAQKKLEDVIEPQFGEKS